MNIIEIETAVEDFFFTLLELFFFSVDNNERLRRDQNNATPTALFCRCSV